MEIQVYRDQQGFDLLRDEWNILVQSSYRNNFFNTWEWQRTWWAHLGRGELWLIALRAGDGSLVGLAPLYRPPLGEGASRLRLVGGREVSDYLDLIVTAGQEQVVCAALLDFLESDAAPPWDVLELYNVPADSAVLSVLTTLAAERGYGVARQHEDVCPVIPLPDTWDAYLSSLDKKQRHEIRRKLRRARREARVHWRVIGPQDDLETAMTVFIALHQKSHPEKDEFMDETMQAFFRAVAQVMQEAGWLQLSFLEVNGQPAASMLCFDYDDAIMVYNSGYDPYCYASLSPGIVCLAYCIQHAIALGRTRFDFLQGGEEYKYRLGGQDTEVLYLTIHRASGRGG